MNRLNFRSWKRFPSILRLKAPKKSDSVLWHMTTKPDRRVLRTRSYLFDALVSLLKEKPFKEISIREPTDRADIARPTFYRNYANIYAILLDELDFRAEGYMIEIARIIPRCERLSILTEILFNRWNDNTELFKAMFRAEMDNFILDRFAAYSEQMLDLINDGRDHPAYTPRLYFFAGGAHNLFKNWLLNGKKEPISDMADILARDLIHLVANPSISL